MHMTLASAAASKTRSSDTHSRYSGLSSGDSIVSNASAARSGLAHRNDFELMEQLESRDPAALESLYDRYAGIVYTLAFRMLHDREEVDELLSDVFLELWLRADRYDPSRGAPITYIMTLARSRAIDRQRVVASRSRGRVVLDLEAEALCSNANPCELAVSTENVRRVRDALCSLDPLYREAVRLSFFDGLSHTQIAKQLDKPLGTVKTYVRQGLIRLRNSLRKDSQ
jgi:RNA polymerase sigma-70 factor (ECF subfamily)